MKIFWTVLEIVLIGAFLLVIGLLRIVPKFVPFIKYTTAKFVMSLGLLYFYYRLLSVFLPISPVLGPMMINFKAMVCFNVPLQWSFVFYFLLFITSTQQHNMKIKIFCETVCENKLVLQTLISKKAGNSVAIIC